MKKVKIIYCIILAAVTFGLSFAAYYYGKVHDIHSRAELLLSREISAVNNKYKAIDSERAQLENQKKSLEKQIYDKSAINKELEENVKDTEQTTKDIEEAKNRIEELDKQIEDRRNTLSDIENISKSADGKKLTLKEGTYSCPKNIAPGRYTIRGSDTLLIYTSSNTLKFSEDLSRLDNNSFTFDIESGEKIKIASNKAD